jgi:hypothetical protein
MDDDTDQRFFDMEEAAEFLKCGEKDILYLVRQKKIPHSVLPFGRVLFDRKRLTQWVLSFEQTPGPETQQTPAKKSPRGSLKEQIIRRFNCDTKQRSKYTNLYLHQQIYAQLHPRTDGNGTDLALRERGDDRNLPKCSLLKRIEIGGLNGFWGTNKSWLAGDGRFTDRPAAAFHIPPSLQSSPENPGWKELQNLLEYTAQIYSKK